jgi:hypothetical protein
LVLIGWPVHPGRHREDDGTCSQCDGHHAHRWVRALVPTLLRRNTSLGRTVIRCAEFSCWPCLQRGCQLRMGHREPFCDYGNGVYW